MLPVIWSQTARESLQSILAYISERNPDAADELLERIGASVLPAAPHPYIFRNGRMPETREIVAHPN